MEPSLTALLTELETFGRDNDQTVSDRPRRMLNITRDTGEFLAVLVQASHARQILEIGTSNGYSTLWLAHAVRAIDGHVTTIECSEYKASLAAGNFKRSGLTAAITQRIGGAAEILQSEHDASYDLVFLDSARSDYPAWWPDIRRVLRPGGLLVVDNAVSHADEMAPFIALVAADEAFSTCTVPVGNGEFLAARHA